MLSLYAQGSIDRALDDLGVKIKERYLYKIEKDRRINALKFRLSESNDVTLESSLCHELFEEYKTFQYDSAYLYALRLHDFAAQSGRDELLAQADCDLLYCYSTAGFFKEGGDIIDSFEYEGLSNTIMANYYRSCIRYYYNLMSFVSSASPLYSKYRGEMLRSTQLSLEYLEPGGFNYDFIEVQSDILLGEHSRESIVKVEELLTTPNLSLNNKAILYSWLGMAHQSLGSIDDAIYYTALSMIADIESCTFETTSAKVLAQYMYEKGDIERASTYIKVALEDANTYNSPYRKLEIQAILPDITDQRFNLMQQDKRFLSIISAIIVLLLLIIIFTLYKIHMRNVALRGARGEIEARASELSTMNGRLSVVNKELSEANQIKDQYIIESLYSDSGFVDSVDNMCKVISRKVKAKQYDDILDLIRGVGIKQERKRMSSTFDLAFLKLFPNFVTEYNKLFDESHEAVLGEAGELTAEMRIFALIRLGIDDVALISKYLNLSLNTVYVYKAKVKARTIVPKDEFETYIKAIKQPY